jgi:hypothetical protein
MNRAASFIFTILILSFGSRLLRAQNSDFQAWPSFQANVEVFKNFRFHIEEEVRFHENLSQVNRQINDLGLSYRFNKAVKAGIFYRIEADWKNADEFSWRKGLYSDISIRHVIERFTFGYRLRIQSLKVERHDLENGLFNGFRHRHKFSAEYDIKGIPLVPCIESELFIDYSNGNLSKITGLRTWIRIDYTLNKIHTLSLKYGIDQEMNAPDPLRAYIVALGYSIDLTLGSIK